ncbi:glycerophosphodiester phosphodiesterase family protein [Euryarchaeota archaeon]|nr:glycerophosphodiester phosphodiesterase family protein [Euryarchaeota archaeon]MDB4865388.1 glycerophosphodiester phosphodiesterase family protein [Euryarchaeota archaeon]MDC0962626.1 glycerophosphodiester phosphodiesterase family protein [Euryarchaeota archaeon]MDC3282242.1 glycerophosphodiester phosphodiesterase family protein [Euryarchaeota archaeon]
MVEHIDWIRPRENTVEALVYGMEQSDGVELDLRLTQDQRLILHHDSKTEFGEYPECLTIDELPDYVEPIDDLLANKDFIRRWTEEGAFTCIEFKSPHPSSGKAGGWFNGKEKEQHMINMIQNLQELLEPIERSNSSTVIYSFDPKIITASKKIKTDLKFSRLRPNIRQWGNWTTQRIVATPSFLANSLPKLMDKQRQEGSPMLPCSLQYLKGIESNINIGWTVGLEGKKLERLTKYRRGYPVYVWPSKSDSERLLLDAGLTGLTDDLSPNSVTLDTGHARWTKPATQPLTDDTRKELDDTPKEEHFTKISELKKEVSPWYELSDNERIKFVDNWRKKWLWARERSTLLNETSKSSLPWEVSRIIGHRGTGSSHKGSS